jgi:hypothetical protein
MPREANAMVEAYAYVSGTPTAVGIAEKVGFQSKASCEEEGKEGEYGEGTHVWCENIPLRNAEVRGITQEN